MIHKMSSLYAFRRTGFLWLTCILVSHSCLAKAPESQEALHQQIRSRRGGPRAVEQLRKALAEAKEAGVPIDYHQLMLEAIRTASPDVVTYLVQEGLYDKAVMAGTQPVDWEEYYPRGRRCFAALCWQPFLISMAAFITVVGVAFFMSWGLYDRLYVFLLGWNIIPPALHQLYKPFKEAITPYQGLCRLAQWGCLLVGSGVLFPAYLAMQVYFPSLPQGYHTPSYLIWLLHSSRPPAEKNALAKLLLQHGADPRALGLMLKKETYLPWLASLIQPGTYLLIPPIYLACHPKYGSSELAKLLKEHGASLDAAAKRWRDASVLKNIFPTAKKFLVAQPETPHQTLLLYNTLAHLWHHTLHLVRLSDLRTGHRCKILPTRSLIEKNLAFRHLLADKGPAEKQP